MKKNNYKFVIFFWHFLVVYCKTTLYKSIPTRDFFYIIQKKTAITL